MRYIGTVNQAVNALAIVAFLVLLAIEFWLVDVPELISGGARLGGIVSALCLAYLASYIFYLVVVHIPEERERERLKDFIALKSRQVLTGILSTTHELFVEAGKEVVRYPSRAEIEVVVGELRMTDGGPEHYSLPTQRIPTWWDYFVYWKKHIDEHIDLLMALNRFLSVEHVQILLDIKDCSWLQVLAGRLRLTDRVADHALFLEDFVDLGHRLEEYLNRHS